MKKKSCFDDYSTLHKIDNEFIYINEKLKERKYTNGKTYKGNLENSYGIIKYTNGDIYEGNWENNMKNGKGIMKYNNGEIYEGEWENNKFKNGTITFKNKKINIQNYSFIINPKQIILIGDSFA